MKKRILALLLAVLFVFACAACGSNGNTASGGNVTAGGSDAPASGGSDAAPEAGAGVTMSTGGNTGTYYAFGNVLSGYMAAASGVSVNVVSSGGSADNIFKIDDGVAHLATVQSDVMSYAWDGVKSFAEEGGAIQSFRVIGGLYAETVQIVTLDPSIKTVADLAGKSVSIGAPGSGVYFNAIDVLGAYDLTEEDIKAEYLSFGESTDAMKDGKIAAAFIVAGPPTPAITELATGNSVYLVDIEDAVADKLIASSPFYTKSVIPANTYSGQTVDCHTVSVKATMIVSASASEDDVYNLTKGIFDNIEAITAAHVKGAELSLTNATEGMTVPFHAGAAKYFAERGITVNAG